MKYDITYSCGHTAVVDLFGKAADRDRKADWMAKSDCPKCYRAKATAETATAIEDIAKLLELPELEGSEKQVKWANDIRANFIKRLDGAGFPWTAVIAGDYPERCKEPFTKALATVKTTSAKVWIDAKGTKLFNHFV